MSEHSIGPKITPHLPVWVQNGNQVLRKREEEFEDRAGNKATLTVVEFVDKKGKEHEVVAVVKWHARFFA